MVTRFGVKGFLERFSLLSGAVFMALAGYVCLLATASTAHAATVTSLGDFGNVTVMEIDGNYDTNFPDGVPNNEPRQLVAQEFFKTHKDEYDFLVVFSNFDFYLSDADTLATYHGIKNDVQGIGQNLFDYSGSYGSEGRLQGLVDMGNLARNPGDPLEREFENTLATLSHEILHRWSAYLHFVGGQGNLSDALLGQDWSHWSFLLDTGGSLQYGNDWVDNGNGTFTAVGNDRYYSPLDLYAMGFIDSSEVPPILLIDNPAVDPAQLPKAGVTIAGTVAHVSIDDIVAAEGERTPAAADAQKEFTSAFIFLTRPGTFTGTALGNLEGIRNGFLTRFSVLTDGKGLMEVASIRKDDLPENPGIEPPATDSRTLPPDVQEGIDWLAAHQNSDGSWLDSVQTVPRDTAEAVVALSAANAHQDKVSNGMDWIAGNVSSNTDYLARKIESLHGAGLDVSGQLAELVARQNKDGGWGNRPIFESNSMDTALVLRSLARVNCAENTVVAAATNYLANQQNPDGGWGDKTGASLIQPTANALIAFQTFSGIPEAGVLAASATNFLLSKQNPDGGFGNSPSTVYDTASAVLALAEGSSRGGNPVGDAVDYLLGWQGADGSWYGSPYQTALAAQAVWKVTRVPDISISTDDITFIPEKIPQIPTSAVISVVVRNDGGSDVAQTTVTLFEGNGTHGTKLDEKLVAVPAGTPVTVTFAVAVTEAAGQAFTIAVDLSGAVKESNENNNQATKVLLPDITYDLQILSGDVSVSESPVDMHEDVTISASVSNNGLSDAYDVPVKIYIDDPATPFQIATLTVDVPAGATIPVEYTWNANKAGTDMAVVVEADPFNAYVELAEDNNQATAAITVNEVILTDPNLTIHSKEIVISPDPVTQGDGIHFTAIVRNTGYSAASDFQVAVYHGDPGQSGHLLLATTVPSIDVDGEFAIEGDLPAAEDLGVQTIFVVVDGQDSVPETRENDNTAFATFRVLSLPDLSVSSDSISFFPVAPKAGETVVVSVTIRNAGDLVASDVQADVSVDGSLVDSIIISEIVGHTTTSVSTDYIAPETEGVRTISVDLDPNDTVTEQREDNNTASRNIAIGAANVRLSEEYFSPNGDGVKDTTDFVFRLNVPASVRVEVVNDLGTMVRTFSGPGFENVTQKSVTWDGLDKLGSVVSDGEYQFRVIDDLGTVLETSIVVVDNNRSPLFDAIDSKYQLKTMLDLPLGATYTSTHYEWFPDERGLLLSSVGRANSQAPNTFPQGLYFVPASGMPTSRITPEEWTNLVDPNMDYSLARGEIAGDGSKIAAYLWGNDLTTVAYPQYENESDRFWLWTMDSTGANLSLIDFRQRILSGTEYIDTGWLGTPRWSGSAEYINYTAVPSAYNSINEFHLASSDGNLNVELHSGWRAYYSEWQWAPDGELFVYGVTSEYPQPGDGLWISDTQGNAEKIFGTSVETADWVGNDNLLIVTSAGADGRKRLVIVNVNDPNEHIEVGRYEIVEWYRAKEGLRARTIAVSPTGESFAYATAQNYREEAQLHVGSPDGTSRLVWQIRADVPSYGYCQRSLAQNLTWAPGGTKLATVLDGSDCLGWDETTGAYFKDRLFIVDVISGEQWTYEFPPVSFDADWELARWLNDGVSIVGRGPYNEGFVFNVETGKFKNVPGVRLWRYDNDGALKSERAGAVSPLGTYINTWQQEFPYRKTILGSAMNLLVNVYAYRDRAVVRLSGTAADVNFDGYRLDYANAEDANNWHPLIPSRDTSVVNGSFGDWVPPKEGMYSVRLTAWDKAGNIKSTTTLVSWDGDSIITDLYSSSPAFSPNGDGVKDVLDISYRALEPVNLDFQIFDNQQRLIRTIAKSHSIPENGTVVWDGRDDGGAIVPDGHYRIRVLTLEIPVDIDTVPPDVFSQIGAMEQYWNEITYEFYLYTNIVAHAVDDGIKTWTLEIGEGDNPDAWYTITRGSDVLVKRNEYGVPLLDPVVDDIVNTYRDNDIQNVVNRKLRIRATDLAGNSAGYVSEFGPEMVLLDRWNGERLILEQSVAKDNVGENVIGITETVRLPIDSATVEYQLEAQQESSWIQAAAEITRDNHGQVDISWDTGAFLNASANYLVRVRVRNSLGEEFVSNAITILGQPVFEIDLRCGETKDIQAYVKLRQTVKQLQFEIQNDRDALYESWTVFANYDVTAGDLIPNDGSGFSVDIPLLRVKDGYQIRMKGTTETGEVLTSNTVGTACTNLNVTATPLSRGCNTLVEDVLVHGAIVPSRIPWFIANAENARMKLYLDGRLIVETAGKDFETTFAGGTVVKTADIPQGWHSTTGVVTYTERSSGKQVSISDGASFITSRELPTVEVRPVVPEHACIEKITPGSNDTWVEWYATRIEGTINASAGIREWVFKQECDICIPPDRWESAYTQDEGEKKAIIGNDAMDGEIAKWDVTENDMVERDIFLSAEDFAGNVACVEGTVSFEELVEFLEIGVNHSVISPNDDGVFDDLEVSFVTDVFSTVRAEVFRFGTYDATGEETLRRLVSAQDVNEGMIVWDGRDKNGIVLEDGRYEMILFGSDICENGHGKSQRVDIDTVAPRAEIVSPQAGDSIGGAVEIIGTVSDEHLTSFSVEAGQGVAPVEWVPIATSSLPADNAVLATWNAIDLQGAWTLRLRAVDAGGNKSETTVVVEMHTGTGVDLLQEPAVFPRVFSPNGDGIIDSATVSFMLAAPANVDIELIEEGGASTVATVSGLGAGYHEIEWNGQDGHGGIPLDGRVQLRVAATSTEIPGETGSQTVTAVIDTVPPSIALIRPVDGEFTGQIVQVEGTIADDNLNLYSIEVAGSQGAVAVDSGKMSREDYVFGVLKNLPDGRYLLTATARDQGGNQSEKVLSFTVDSESPLVGLDSPDEGAFFGSNNGVIRIVGTVTDPNLDHFIVRNRNTAAGGSWQTLFSSDLSVTKSQLVEWNVEASSGLADGQYDISLVAFDKGGLSDEATVSINVDNGAPIVSLDSPVEDSFITRPIDVTGTVSDAYLRVFDVTVSTGDCAGAQAWSRLNEESRNVSNGVLARWSALPEDGVYCVRLSAQDWVGNVGEVTATVHVDTRPPTTPALTGMLDETGIMHLSWTKSLEQDVAGYNLYRNSQRLNEYPIQSQQFEDTDIVDGKYAYTVAAVDTAGNESVWSNAVYIEIDRKGPTTTIKEPVQGSRVTGHVSIKGTAYSADDFKEYRVYVRDNGGGGNWSLLRRSPVPIIDGELVMWDSSGVVDGTEVTLRLESEDLSGNVNSDNVTVVVDSAPPIPPTLLSVDVVAGTQNTVAVEWEQHPDPDVVGFVLYRNGGIANAQGGSQGGLAGYMLSGTSYTDKNLPDDLYVYSLVAVDAAGNISLPSTSLSVKIDIRAPRAEIVEPLNNTRFEQPFRVRAESDDRDVTSIRFEYRAAEGLSWKPFGPVKTSEPYSVYFDPAALGIDYGDYLLRAVATDTGGKVDASPPAITVTYTDLTPPAKPQQFSVHADGSTVQFSWAANSETDLAGYYIFETQNPGDLRINSYPITSSEHVLLNQWDGEHNFYLKAVDLFENESEPSISQTVRVYSPVLESVESPTADQVIELRGSGVEPDAVVEVSVDTGSGPSLHDTVLADSSGMFQLPLSLEPGENSITVRATDVRGDRSRVSNVVKVLYDERPSPPEGLEAAVDGYDVHLSWVPNSEPDVVGYNVFRDGEKIHGANAGEIARNEFTSIVVSSSLYSWSGPENLFDGVDTSYWYSAQYPWGSVFIPQWVQVDFAVPKVVTKVDIAWGYPAVGAVYEIQEWTGTEWTTIGAPQSVPDTRYSATTVNGVEAISSLRILVSEISPYWNYIAIGEVRITAGDSNIRGAYVDTVPGDGRYAYAVSAVDEAGFESAPSAEIEVVVGDVTPPAPPAQPLVFVDHSNVLLDWSYQPNGEEDLKGYNVYRRNGEQWLQVNGGLVTEGNAYEDKNLEIADDYFYRITAVDTAGNESGPSPEVKATVLVVTPVAPSGLTVSTVPSGLSLKLEWNASVGDVFSHRIGRAETSGGPYTWIGTVSGEVTSYVDAGLTSGITYYYVVTNVDVYGNESDYSQEAFGVPTDVRTLEKPELWYPAAPGQRRRLLSSRSAVSGTGEPGTIMEIFINDAFGGSTHVRETDLENTLGLKAYGNAGFDIAPSGRVYAFVDANSKHVVVVDEKSGETIDTGEQGALPRVSPDEKKVLFVVSSNQLKVFDLQERLTTVIEENMSTTRDGEWMPNGKEIVFVGYKNGYYDIFKKNLETDVLEQVTENSYYAERPKASHNGDFIAYREWSRNLWVLDRQTGARVQVALGVNSYDNWSWSPGSNTLVYTKSYRIYTVDMPSLEVTEVSPASGTRDTKPAWGPLGNSLVFSRYDYSDWQYKLVLFDLDNHTTRVIEASAVATEPWTLVWSRSGRLAWSDASDIRTIDLRGTFFLAGAQLAPGENAIYAESFDEYGTRSEASEMVSVVYDIALLPDLFVSSDNITTYPEFAVSGDPVAINVRVENRGGAQARDVAVDVYVRDGEGGLTFAGSESIGVIEPGESVTVGASYDSTGKKGVNTVLVVVDPEDRSIETAEDNNFASRDFLVVDQAGISLNAILDKTEYGSFESVAVTVDVVNTGNVGSGTLDVWIEDAAGERVAEVYSGIAAVTYGASQHVFVWETGSTFEGEYSVRVQLTQGSKVTAEDTEDFVISRDEGYDVVLRCDKNAYGPYETVTLEGEIDSVGTNAIGNDMVAMVQVRNAIGEELFRKDVTLPPLLPGMNMDLAASWNTGIESPGIYSAGIFIYEGADLVAEHIVEFSIEPVVRIGGKVELSDSVIPEGNECTADISIESTGNVDIVGAEVELLVVRGGTETVTEIREKGIALPAAGVLTYTYKVPTENLQEGEYLVRLMALYEETTYTLDEKRFRVQDVSPPSLAVLSPVQGSYQGTTVELQASARDTGSGVALVESSFGGVEWTSMLGVGVDLYVGHWNSTIAGEGMNSILFRATDTAGNVTEPVAVEFPVDLTPPVSTLRVGDPKIEGAGVVTVTCDTAFTLEASDQGSGVAHTEYRIDEGPWVSAQRFSVSNEGVQTIWYRAIDRVGNIETERPFSVEVVRSLDDTPPVTTITVGTPNFEGDRLYVSDQTTFTLAAIDDVSGVAKTEYRTDGGAWSLYGEPFNLEREGPVAIGYRSTDAVGNVEQEQILAAVVDATSPVSMFSAAPALLPDILNTVSGKTVFSLDATDALSGLRELSYRIDDGAWRSAESARFSLAGEEPGNHTITHTSVDNVDNAEEETSTNVRLVDVTVTKEVDTAPAVLIWGHCSGDAENDPDDGNDGSHEDGGQPCKTALNQYENDPDGEGRDEAQHCDTLRTLENMLKEGNIEYTSTSDRETFTSRLRSGKFNVVAVVDRTDETMAEELSATVYGGVGAIMLDPPAEDLGSLEEVFGVKTRGMNRQAGLAVVLEENPLGVTGEIRLSGRQKVVRAILQGPDALPIGFVTDGRREHPVVVLNTFGDGAAVYTGFDPTSAIDRELTNELVQKMVRFVVPQRRVAGALDEVSVRIDLANSTEPVSLRVAEDIPPALRVEEVQPAAALLNGTITWDLDLSGTENAALRYRAIVPDKAGDYWVDSDLQYKNGEEYFPLNSLSLNLGPIRSGSDVLGAALEELRILKTHSRDDERHVRNAFRALGRIVSTREGRPRVERNIEQVLEAIREVSQIEGAVESVRHSLSDLLRYWQRVWNEDPQGKNKPGT